MKKKILIGIGTRPEAIKLCPLILELKTLKQFEVVVCSTGQHKEMLDDVTDFFDVKVNMNFYLMDKSKDILDMASQAIVQMSNYIDSIKPDLVIGQGDTTTALVMALSSYYKKIPFAHLEAGLRTDNIYSPWPEEGNRRMISTISSLHFAPTNKSKDNLLNEGVSSDAVFVTGNTVIDALFYTEKKISTKPEKFNFLNSDKKIVLITGHRRENLGTNFNNIFGAVVDLAKSHKNVQFVFPMHPSPVVRKNIADVFMDGGSIKNLSLIEPLNYPEFVWLMKESSLIITDSGGVQEEAPSLGVPVLVTRETTERSEGVDAGVVKLVGVEREEIVRFATELLEGGSLFNSMSKAKNPYGDGTSSFKIGKIISNFV